MDRLIKEALEERATEAVIPADAWERQRVLLAASGAAGGHAVCKPWWRRWGMVAEVAAVGVLMVGLVAAGSVYGPLRPGGGEEVRTRAVDPPVHDDLNPRGTPPTPHVVTAPGLPVLTPPEGSMTQEQIMAVGLAAANQDARVRGGQLTLSRIALVDDRWELEFRGDGRVFTFSGGPRPSDPRKGAYSHVVPVDQLTYQIIGATGEIDSVQTTGGPLATSRTDLEHYRGFVVSGGEQTTLRLVRADGGREGRDLAAWVPGQALSESGLDLWRLNYGTGREIDVWGLTIAPGEVLAYRVHMKGRPGEVLLAHDLMHGIPLPDGAEVTNAVYQDGAGYTLADYTVASLMAWYEEKMPKYGWEQLKQQTLSNGDARVLRFENHGWQYAVVGILPDANGVQFTLTWGMTRLGNQDQAVAAVFRQRGDNPDLRQFPRTQGTVSGEINIGGPAPGVTIPATFETRVRKMPDGAWEVELVRSWGEGLRTTWRFRVEEDGVVHGLGQSGDLPPAIP